MVSFIYYLLSTDVHCSSEYDEFDVRQPGLRPKF